VRSVGWVGCGQLRSGSVGPIRVERVSVLWLGGESEMSRADPGGVLLFLPAYYAGPRWDSAMICSSPTNAF
jgi:hypothetical protein